MPAAAACRPIFSDCRSQQRRRTDTCRAAAGYPPPGHLLFRSHAPDARGKTVELIYPGENHSNDATCCISRPSAWSSQRSSSATWHCPQPAAPVISQRLRTV
jgi:hypothetical protein